MAGKRATPTDRQLQKKLEHAVNYGASAETLARMLKADQPSERLNIQDYASGVAQTSPMLEQLYRIEKRLAELENQRSSSMPPLSQPPVQDMDGAEQRVQSYLVWLENYIEDHRKSVLSRIKF